MDHVLRGFQPALEQQLGGVGGLHQDQPQFLALGGGEVLEDEVRRVLPARGPADADPHAEVVAGAHRAADRPQPVVAALPASALEPDRGERDVQLVVDDDEVGHVEVVVVEQAADRAARLVHIGRRTGQDHAPAGQPALTGQRARTGALAGGQPDAGAVGQLVEHHRADVVPVARVARTRVAEADDEERALGRRAVGDGGAGGIRCSGAPGLRAVGQRSAQLFSVDATDSPLPWSCGSGTTSPSPAAAAASPDSSRSMPASASARSRSPSRAWADCAAETFTTRASASVSRVAPVGSDSSPAVTPWPASRPVTSTSMCSGMLVAATCTETVFSSMLTIVSGAASPVTTTGTSTVTFSPRRTMTRATCSCLRVSGSRCTALVSASWSLPFRTMVSRALLPPLRSAAATSRAGRDRCTSSWPCP